MKTETRIEIRWHSLGAMFLLCWLSGMAIIFLPTLGAIIAVFVCVFLSWFLADLWGAPFG
jgi:hypothetical protein